MESVAAREKSGVWSHAQFVFCFGHYILNTLSPQLLWFIRFPPWFLFWFGWIYFWCLNFIQSKAWYLGYVPTNDEIWDCHVRCTDTRYVTEILISFSFFKIISIMCFFLHNPRLLLGAGYSSLARGLIDMHPGPFLRQTHEPSHLFLESKHPEWMLLTLFPVWFFCEFLLHFFWVIYTYVWQRKGPGGGGGWFLAKVLPSSINQLRPSFFFTPPNHTLFICSYGILRRREYPK